MKILCPILVLLLCLVLFSGCITSPTPQAKITVRELANPIADVATFNSIVSSVITDNPFGCTAYEADGQRHPPVDKIREAYSARLVFEDANASVVNTVGYESSTVQGFNTGIAVLMASTPLAKAQGGTAVHDPGEDSYYTMLQCHDPNGEIYYVIFNRNSVVLSQYSDNAIRTRFETWANGQAALTPAGGEVRSPAWWDREIVLP